MPSPLRPGLVACIAAAALLASGGTAAQGLAELYEAARAFDASYLASRALAASAEHRVTQAEALLKPTASLTASATTVRTDPPSVGAVGSTTAQGALSGRWPLLNAAGRTTIEQARRGLESSAAELEAAEQDLVVRVAQAYFDVLAAQDQVATARQSKAAITEQLASARRNFEVGTATITDTREAQARFDLASATEIAAENDLRAKRIALDQLVGRQNIAPRPLAVPVVLPPVLPADPEAWVGTADAAHPAIRRARVALDVAQLEVQKARAAELPTVDAVGSLLLSNARGSAVALPGNTSQGSVGVQLSWPILTGGATQGRISETLALEEKSRNDVEAARRAVAQGTRTAYFGVQSGLAQVKALEAAEASSKLALEATQLGYRVGVRVNLDVLNAQRDLFQTQRDLARARYDVLLGSLRLRQASGQLGAGDVQAVSRLLAP
jgi:outer membrane protein